MELSDLEIKALKALGEMQDVDIKVTRTSEFHDSNAVFESIPRLDSKAFDPLEEALEALRKKKLVDSEPWGEGSENHHSFPAGYSYRINDAGRETLKERGMEEATGGHAGKLGERGAATKAELNRLAEVLNARHDNLLRVDVRDGEEGSYLRVGAKIDNSLANESPPEVREAVRATALSIAGEIVHNAFRDLLQRRATRADIQADGPIIGTTPSLDFYYPGESLRK